MQKHVLVPLAAAITILACSLSARAAPDQLGWISIELDPITTPLGARNFFVRLEPRPLPHWSFSAAVFAADFPGFVDDILSYRNRGEGFERKTLLSPGVAIDYFTGELQAGWHAGIISFLWRNRVARGSAETDYLSHVVLPRLGYRWFPSSTVKLYLNPFGGLMLEYKLSGESQVDGSEYKTTSVVPFASVHFGFNF